MDITREIEDDKAATIRVLSHHVLSLKDRIENLLPPSRERSLAITKIEEGWLWTLHSITTNGTFTTERLLKYEAQIKATEAL